MPMDADMLEPSMMSYIETTFLIRAAAHLTGLADNSAIDVAVAEARRHCHNSFIWSITTRQNNQSVAVAAINRAKQHARSKASSGRLKLYDFLATHETRPVTQSDQIVFSTKSRYKTAHADEIMAFWHVCHPAQLFITQLIATHLTNPDPSAIEGAFTQLVSPEAVSQRAATLTASCALLMAL